VEILVNGQIVGIWDVRNDQGDPVPNGVYHVVLKMPDAEGIIRTFVGRIDLLLPGPSGALAFAILPNTITAGAAEAAILVTHDGWRVSGWSVKVYDVAGELVRILTVENGRSAWDARSPSGRLVASGVYILLLEGSDRKSGQPVRALRKILVVH
jgi:hypothetical protein